jgi:hypothetical protein
MKNITKNLVLQSIESNNWKHDKEGREITICWVLFFEFFGVGGFSAFITDDDLNRDYPRFQMVESEEGDLHDSFTDQLEDNWEKLVEACKDFERENFAAQSALVGVPA